MRNEEYEKGKWGMGERVIENVRNRRGESEKG
jgi:hypothetical protein